MNPRNLFVLILKRATQLCVVFVLLLAFACNNSNNNDEKKMKTLLIIDVQNDFCSGGALAVPDGDSVVQFANSIKDKYDLVIASKDWHPSNHKSFASQHEENKVGDMIELNGISQVLWPDHCVQESHGSELHPQLDTTNVHIIYKGMDIEVDSYSAFFDNGGKNPSGLEKLLKDKGVEEVDIMGLATDYCVKYTALDALSLGFKVNVLVEGCRGIDLNEGDIDKALDEIAAKGGHIIRASN